MHERYIYGSFVILRRISLIDDDTIYMYILVYHIILSYNFHFYSIVEFILCYYIAEFRYTDRILLRVTVHTIC